MESRELVCIGCPLGCNLKVTREEDQEISVTGNTCPRGADYARKELTDPRRIVTSSVRVKGGHLPSVSVKTETDIPKDKIFACIRALKEIELTAPVTIGQVVVENVADTGVKVIATKNIYRQ
jgi:CxxC motif-containing protein